LICYARDDGFAGQALPAPMVQPTLAATAPLALIQSAVVVSSREQGTVLTKADYYRRFPRESAPTV